MKVVSSVKNYTRNLFDNESLTVKQQLGYAGGIFGNCMGQDSVSTYGDKFERDFVGINKRNMLIKDLVSKGIGFLLPPFIGSWYDTPAKEGRHSHIRTALSIMPIPFAIFSMLLFIVPSQLSVFSSVFDPGKSDVWAPTLNFYWAFICGLLFTCADTFFDLAMDTLGLKLCRNPKDRKTFFSLISLMSSLGSALPGWLIPMIVGKTPDQAEKQLRYFMVALVFCLVGVVTMYSPVFTLRRTIDDCVHRLDTAKRENEKETVVWNAETVRTLLHNRPFLIMQLSRYFEMIRQITYRLLPYLYEDVLNDLPMKSIVDVISGSLAYVGVVLLPTVGAKLSARGVMIGGYVYTGFFYLIMSLFNFSFDFKNFRFSKSFDLNRLRKYRWVIGGCIGLAGMPNYAQSAAKKIISADSTDYMEWYGYKHFGAPVRSDGLLSAAGNVNTKVIDILSSLLYNGLFGIVKYQERDLKSDQPLVQSDFTLHGLFLVATLSGLAGNTLAALSFLLDNYTGSRRETVLRELQEFRAQTASDENDTSETS